MYTKLYSTSRIVFIYFFVFLISSCNNDKKEEISKDPKVAALKLPADFHADHLYSPGENEQGSWVAMTFDNKGRMITSDQYGNLYRLVIPAIGADTSKEKIKVEKIEVQLPDDTSAKARRMGYAHGLLYAFNSLYVMVNDEGDLDNSKPSGLYRLQDTDNDDQYDKITLLRRLEGEGEHGPHSIVLSPDRKSLYVIAGNFTKIPKMDQYAAATSFEIDNLLPLVRDPNGHDGTVNTHGGWIAQIDSTGGNFNLISAGFRNPFDLAFNESGDIFTFDSDMEWDFGLPWYRPVRICHVPSGGEFGWRPGTDKWSPTNPDNLPALLNIGQGSPTGVFSGMNAHFPEKYRRSIFAFDWTFGVMYAIQPIAEGASYTPKAEEFISGAPLPLTDGMVGPDGAVYFLTGGRRIESDLYRVYYKDNKQNTDQLAKVDLTEAQKIRKKLETYHTAPKADAIETSWQYLKNEDRFIRYAARMAVEHQPAQEWSQKTIDEKDPVILTQAAIAQARLGNTEIKEKLLQALTTIDFSKLSDDQRIDLVRAFELIYLRLGNPSTAIQSQVIAYLDAQYPAQTNNLNRSLSKMLVYLDAPGSVEKTMKLMATAKDDPNDQKTFMESSDLILRNPRYGLDIASMLASVPPKQQTFYATVLSQAKNGWTPALQEEYFKWFYTAFGYKGGYSFVGFINIVRNNALKNVSKDKLAYFKTMSGDSLVERAQMGLAQNDIQPKGPGKRWEVDTALAFLKDGMGVRNFEHGKAMFAASLCVKCHVMNGQGGIAGPNLTNVGTRFSYKDMLESIIEPNKTISDQFASTVFYLKDGSSVVGKMMNEDDKNYYIGQNPFAMQVVKEVPKKNVIRTRASKESFMMGNLINRLNPEEMKDLLAYMKSGGNSKDSLFIAKSNN